MTDDMIAWLTVQVDADEAAARARRGVFPNPVVWDDGGVALHAHANGEAVIVWLHEPREGYGDLAALRAWADADDGWSAARVLREIKFKRALIDNYAATVRIRNAAAQRIRDAGDHPSNSDLDEWARADREAGILAEPVHDLAAVYADRDGYKEEWAV